jgi:hypothetical protein
MTKEAIRTARVTSVHELAPGAEFTLEEFQVSASGPSKLHPGENSIYMVNMKIECEKKTENYEILPGIWRITPESGLQPLEIPEVKYFETETSKTLLAQFTNFRKKLAIYDKYGITKKRGVLLGSVPGIGKTSLTNYFCRGLKDQPKTCILRIDSSQVSWETVTTMFMESSMENSGVELIVLIIEDIGGTGLEGQDSGRVSPQLLNFLDGNVDAFKIPTLIIGTTNFLDNVGETLTNRPGRFDVVLQVMPPSDEETFWIVQQFLQRELTSEEKRAFAGQQLTPAYAKEAVVRSELNDITLEEAVVQLVEQKKRAEKHSHTAQRNGSVGFSAY